MKPLILIYINWQNKYKYFQLTTCNWKKGLTCHFNAPWPPSGGTSIASRVKDKTFRSRKTKSDLLQIAQMGTDGVKNKVLALCDLKLNTKNPLNIQKKI